MREVELRGTYFEIGAEVGRILRRYIDGGGDYTPIRQSAVTEDRRKLARGCEKAVEEHTPSLLEELDAIIETGGFADSNLRDFELTLAAYPRFGCSIFAVSGQYTKSGKTIFARDYDWNWSFQDYLMLLRTYPKKRLASLGCSDILVGRYGGINEAGLAIGLTAIPGYHKPDSPGVMLHLATRWILDNCRTVNEAVEFMERIPHVRGNNYLVTDKSGGMAMIQACPEKVVVLGPEDGLVVATNHFQSPDMQVYENKANIPLSTVRRHDYIRDWLVKRKEKVDIKMVQQVQKGSENDREGVCQDYTVNGERFGTIWAWTHEAGTRTMELAGGSPSEVEFVPYTY